MHTHARIDSAVLQLVFALAVTSASAWGQTLTAVNDLYQVVAGDVLAVEKPGVLANDTLDGGGLPATATAVLVNSDTILFGNIACPGSPAPSICADGSFVYTSDPGFAGVEAFTYRVVDGASMSNVATVVIRANGCEGGPDLFVCWFESSYLTKLAELGFTTFQEGFENDTPWALVREPEKALSVSSQNVLWTPNNTLSQLTTGAGPARTGTWGFYEAPHGDTRGALFDWLRDGFIGTWTGSGKLRGAGGWIMSTLPGSKVRFVVDGVEVGFRDPVLDPVHRFFGVIKVSGFTAFEVYETEGTVQDQKFLFADDFTFGVSTGAPDSVPPRVMQVNSVQDTGNGALSEGEITTAAITQLLVRFSEHVRDSSSGAAADDVTNPANYLLVHDGGDGTVSTASCFAGAHPSDTSVPVDFVTYISGSFLEATLDLNGGFALPSGQYRLLVCGSTSIKDPAGNSLDGNGNGIGGDDFVLNFAVTPQANRPPTAAGDSYTTPENTALIVGAPGVLANDTDADGNALTAILVAGPASGALALNANGSFTYTPAANFTGAASFTYKANDGSLDSNTATVTITVTAVNDAPAAAADAYTTPEDTALTVAAPGVLGNDTDADGNALTAILVAGPAGGALALNANGSFTYTPAANFTGAASFTYKANDGSLDSNTVTVTITVTAVNDAPAAAADAFSTPKNTALSVAAPGLLANDADPEGGALTAILVAGPAGGILALNGNGGFTYTPAANFTGIASFTYKANDGSLDSNTVTVTIAVNLSPQDYSIDFNGDSIADTFLHNPAAGNWSQYSGSGSAFANTANGWWSPGWQVTPSEFNADGITDLFLYNPDYGYWYKAIGNGSGGFTYFSGQWSAGWEVHSADLDGDGRSDIFLFHPTLGIWYRCISPANPADGFSYTSGYWSAGWSVYTLDWNGDGKADLFLYNKVNGSWYQVTNIDPDPAVWSYSPGSWMPGWDIQAGDFNGDGKSDLFLYMPGSGAWYVAMNTGSGFSYTAGYWAPGWSVNTGDFNDDGATDIFVYSTATGQWYECISDKTGYFSAYYSGNWATVWQVHVTDFNNDGKADVLLYWPDYGSYYLCVTQTTPGSFGYYPGSWTGGMTVMVKRKRP